MAAASLNAGRTHDQLRVPVNRGKHVAVGISALNPKARTTSTLNRRLSLAERGASRKFMWD